MFRLKDQIWECASPWKRGEKEEKNEWLGPQDNLQAAKFKPGPWCEKMKLGSFPMEIASLARPSRRRFRVLTVMPDFDGFEEHVKKELQNCTRIVSRIGFSSSNQIPHAESKKKRLNL